MNIILKTRYIEHSIENLPLLLESCLGCRNLESADLGALRPLQDIEIETKEHQKIVGSHTRLATEANEGLHQVAVASAKRVVNSALKGGRSRPI